jgi:hypothetical protein
MKLCMQNKIRIQSRLKEEAVLPPEIKAAVSPSSENNT